MKRDVASFRNSQHKASSIVCLEDTEDSQKEESCNNQDVKEQRQRQESLWHLCVEGLSACFKSLGFELSLGDAELTQV